MVVLAVDVVVTGAIVVAARVVSALSSALSLHEGNSNTTTVSGINQRGDSRRNIGAPPSAAATGRETAYVSSTTKRIPLNPAVQTQTEPYALVVPDSDIFDVADTVNHRVQRLRVLLDGDGDGMDDMWEDANGLDPNDPNDWDDDPDGDGLSNIGEYRIGTDPQNWDSNGDGISDGPAVANCMDPNAAFDGIRITDIVSGLDVLSWTSSSGIVYTIEFGTNLIDTNWSGIATVPSTSDDTTTWTNPVVPTDRLYYYRVVE